MSSSRVKDIYNDIKQGKLSFDSAAALYTQRTGYRERNGSHGTVQSPNKFAEKAESLNLKTGEYSEPYKNDAGYSIIKVNSFEPKRRLTFEEALPRISSLVQASITKELENN